MKFLIVAGAAAVVALTGCTIQINPGLTPKAAPVETASPTPTPSPTPSRTLAPVPTPSATTFRPKSILLGVWSQMSEADRETIREGWRLSLGYPSRERVYISTIMDASTGGDPEAWGVTRQDVEEYLDWTLVN